MESTRSATRSNEPVANEHGSDPSRSEDTGHQRAFDNGVQRRARRPSTVSSSYTAHAGITAPDDDMPESSAAAAARLQARRHFATPQYSSEPYEKRQPVTEPETGAQPQQATHAAPDPQLQAAHAEDVESQLISLRSGPQRSPSPASRSCT